MKTRIAAMALSVAISGGMVIHAMASNHPWMPTPATPVVQSTITCHQNQSLWGDDHPEDFPLCAID